MNRKVAEDIQLPHKKNIYNHKNIVYCKSPDCDGYDMREALELYNPIKYEYVYLTRREWNFYAKKQKT